MASGFVTRSKGKSSFQSLWIGGAQIGGPGTVVAYSTAGTQTLGAERVSQITGSSGASVFTMGTPPPIGVEKLIAIVSVSSAIFVKAPTGYSFDPSTNTVFKSTYAQQVAVVTLTTAKLSISGVWPPPSTLVGGSGITLSTTT